MISFMCLEDADQVELSSLRIVLLVYIPDREDFTLQLPWTIFMNSTQVY